MNEHSKYFYLVKTYYESNLWNTKAVKNAVTKPKNNPWITAEEFEEITGEIYQQ